MYKVAILGTENTHALNFAKLINGGHSMRENRGYSDIEVVGAYGYDEKANEEIVKEGKVPYIAKNYDEFVGKVDAVLITARHGDNHLKYARPYLESKIPMFIDKPITIKEEEAIELAELARENGVPLCGGSVLKSVTDTKFLKGIVNDPQKPLGKIMGGSVYAPIDLKNEYGDFFFYSQHLVQIIMEVFGYGIKSVVAYPKDDTVTVICRYEDYDVSAHYGPRKYAAVICGENKILFREIDIATDGYAREVEEFADMLRSRKMTVSYTDFIKPVFVLNAIQKSIDTKTEVMVRNWPE
jgi:hypothetical protein